MGGGFTIGHHQDDRLRVRVASEMSPGQRQRVVQVGALLVDALQTGQLRGRHGPRVATERDDLQGIRTEPRAHEVVERQRRALHRQPPILHHHRKRGVHQERNRGLSSGLSLGDFDVIDGDPDRAGAAARRRRTGLAQHRVGQRARDVPRFGVTELPGPGRAGQLTGRPARR